METETNRDDLSRLLSAAEELNNGVIKEFTKSVKDKNGNIKEIPTIKFCGWCHPDFNKIPTDYSKKWIESGVCGNHIRELKLLG